MHVIVTYPKHLLLVLYFLKLQLALIVNTITTTKKKDNTCQDISMFLKVAGRNLRVGFSFLCALLKLLIPGLFVSYDKPA